MATSDEELTVWVGGLDPQVTTEILWELFVQVRIILGPGRCGAGSTGTGGVGCVNYEGI